MSYESGRDFVGIRAFETRPFGAYRHALKRTLDILFVLLVAPIALLILGVAAILVKRDGASAFYCQERIGQNGTIYKMYKLRSMVPNADNLLEHHLEQNPEARKEWDLYQKLSHDPRITPIGRILRKSSIDELPQLLNVLLGDMSLVGPRPMMRNQKDLYPGAAYYSMRPGITGYWQISERNECSFAERALFDTSYYRDLSLRTDFVVLLRTVSVVLRGTGH
ncbi:sugar transferase [Cochlodiniinecator piscidefendens]|uniref:sugar transferase n=1 Tax=Cochlodiniinecator piscidefendens TaxID=2715756 RepID=UPI00140A209A|nr:sugar transferase [Cochlodiniinecator piscidefendens]